MKEDIMTISNLFLPEKNGQIVYPAEWNILIDRLQSELKAIRSNLHIPEISKKILELFNVKISDILLGAWKKIDEIRELLDESEKVPDEALYLELLEHEITSEHRPYMEIIINKIHVKKIEFLIKISLMIDGFILKIKEGEIKEIQTGKCQFKGTIEYEGTLLLNKNLGLIELPGTIQI